MIDERYEKGLQIMRKLFGRKPDRAHLPEQFFDLTIGSVYGEVWTRPGMSLEQRSLSTITILATLGKADELQLHLRGAKNIGIQRDTVEEIMYHVACYSGWPAALEAFKCIDRIYGERKNDQQGSSHS